MLNKHQQTSLVVQWLKIHLPMQETWVQSLVQEDSTCHGKTKPQSHIHWAHAPRTYTLQQEKLPQWKAHALQLEKACTSNEDPVQPKKIINTVLNRKKETEVAQACLTLCNPVGCSTPGSSVHGIFQARVLEWVAISFSKILKYLCI